MSDIALGNLLTTIAQILNMVLTAYTYVIVARALVTWVNPDPYNPIVRFLFQATEPVLRPIRRMLPATGGIDISPIIVIIIIYFIQSFAIKTLLDVAMRIKLGGGI